MSVLQIVMVDQIQTMRCYTSSLKMEFKKDNNYKYILNGIICTYSMHNLIKMLFMFRACQKQW